MIAVSGGSDSIALLIAAHELITGAGASTRLTAVTVDHRLRADSTQEAKWVSDLCGSLGVEHRTATWDHSAVPATRIAASARRARYRLLAEEGKRCGAQAILTGHTFNDQIETVEMRLRRGGDRGISGMAPLTLFANRIWIARPLLSISRDQLRSYLKARGRSWIDDPSNMDRRSERVRIRQNLASDHDREKAVGLIVREAQERRLTCQREAADQIRRDARQVATDLYRVDAGLFRAAENDGAVVAMRALLAVIGGRTYFADSEKVKTLMSVPAVARTRIAISGCVVETDRRSVHIWREFRGPGPKPVPAIKGAVWDRRWRLVEDPGMEGLFIAPSGKPVSEKVETDSAATSGRMTTGALAAMPVLKNANGEAAGRKVRFGRVLSPWLEYMPSFDLELATALNHLAGGEVLAEIPEGLKKMRAI